jgi:hypothetical protein
MRSWAIALIVVGLLPLVLSGAVSIALGDEAAPAVSAAFSPATGFLTALCAGAVALGAILLFIDVKFFIQLERDNEEKDRQEAERLGIADPEFIAARRRLRELKRRNPHVWRRRPKHHQ